MFYHTSVMPAEVLEALRVKAGGLYFDGTLGGGGHSLEILRRGGRVIATDLDGDAIAYASALFDGEGFAGRYELIRGNFKNFSAYMDERGVASIDGALLDLGVSSHQFDEPSRGFSYRFDARLDMRMNTDQELSAYDVVNGYTAAELTRILYEYGEEPFAKRIAANIVREREKSPVETTGRLTEIIERSVPHRKVGHPAKQSFQALRIEVNGELDGLGRAVEDIARRLKTGGRICVLTFHSLEDRIVKRTLRTMATDCLCDKSLPVCVCGHKAEVKLVKVNGNGRAGAEELKRNSRSSSATLRVAERI